MTEIKALAGLVISSMTLLSTPFNGSGLGLEWNWVIIDKKEMTSQEVRELKELY